MPDDASMDIAIWGRPLKQLSSTMNCMRAASGDTHPDYASGVGDGLGAKTVDALSTGRWR